MTTRIQTRLTQPWKLVSLKLTLLGTIVFPLRWEELGFPERRYRFYLPGLTPIRFCERPSAETAPVRTGEIRWINHPTLRTVVVLGGLNLAEFEQIPDCSFQPGAGYLRSLVE